jgi:integrase
MAREKVATNGHGVAGVCFPFASPNRARTLLGSNSEPNMKLTKEVVTALTLPPGKIDHFEWDEALPSFGVRLRGKAKTWVVQYRIGAQQRRESLGDVRKITLEDARKIARQRFAQVELGVDPAVERARARAAALTLAVVSNRYLEAKKDVMRPNTYKAAERYFRIHWKPLHDRPIEGAAKIGRANVAARLQELTKQHGRTSAARARDYLSAMFSWSMKEGLCESNPVLATNDPTAGRLPRDRVLADHEIRTIWNACQDDNFGRILKLLLLTGCRREEIGALKWGEVNLNTGLLSIPGSRTKNHRTHELTLPQVAIDLLRSAPRLDGQQYVFATRGCGPFSGWSAAKLRLDSRIVLTTGQSLSPWTLHDLRRTMRSGLGRLGVPPHIAELAINHVRGGVQAIYDRYQYKNEIAAALALWADHIHTLVEGGERKVLAFPKTAKDST